MGNVKRNDSPLLVIGLGGTGVDGLLRVKSEFAKHFEGERLPDGTTRNRPPRTEYLGIDTDMSVGEIVKHGMKLMSDEFCYIGGDSRAVCADLKDKQYVSEWVDRRIANYAIHGDGAGAIRQVSRLLLFHNFNKIRNAIGAKLAALSRSVSYAYPNSTEIQVRIIAGICGGTGSGILLDVAYIIRELTKNMRANVKAFLIMPDVTVGFAAQGNPAMTNILQANSYCLLKELDYWMAAEQNGLKFVQQYTDFDRIAWDRAPFDDVYLQCAQNEAGVYIRDAYNCNLEMIAEYLTQCFEGSRDSSDTCITGGMGVFNASSQGAADFNVNAIISQMHHGYPVSYRYRTLGAFSNANDNRLLKLTEWGLIYTETTKHLAENECHMDGHAPAEFKEKVLGFAEAGSSAAGQVRQKYEERFAIPNFRDLYTNIELRELAADATPHGKEYTAFETQLREAHGDCKTAMAEQVWDVFMAEAREIAEDLNRGPAYLLDLLRKGENSLSVALDQFIAANEEKMNRADSGKRVLMSEVRDQYNVFMSRNNLSILFGLDKAPYDLYMNMVGGLYGAARAYEYYRALKFALEEYRQKLNRFTAVLSDMVAQIKMRRDDIVRELDTTVAPTLLDMRVLQSKLTQIFAEQDIKDTFTRAMFKQILEITAQGTNGMIRPGDLPDLVEEANDALREIQFIEVGRLSLSQKISFCNCISCGGPMQWYSRDNIAPKFDEGARPLFSATRQTNNLDENHAARVSTISVPYGENEIFEGITAYCNERSITAIIKRTSNANRILWVNDKSGLPLYFYDQLPVLRDAYRHAVDVLVGYHLYMPDVESADPMKRNWSNAIPEPVFSRTAKDIDPNSMRIAAAEDAGCLEYTFNLPYGESPSVKIEAVYLKKIDGEMATPESVGAKLDAVKVDIISVQGLPIADESTEELSAKLSELREMGSRVAAMTEDPVREELKVSHLNDKAKDWGYVLGIFEVMQCLRFDAPPSFNEVRANAWKEAYPRAIRETLSRRPYLLQRLDSEVACRNMIAAKLAEINEAIAEVQGRINAIKNKG